MSTLFSISPDVQINIERIKMREDWKDFLKEEFQKPYFLNIKKYYLHEKTQGKIIFPPAERTFNAFHLASLQSLKIVLLGQDPYHQPNQAMGLSFSVPRGVKIPPSLQNIYKELHRDLGILPALHGDLSFWAKQGVLLLNSILSVECGKPASHAHFGWQYFTDSVIQKLSTEKNGLIFLLWGNFARAKKALIDPQKHFILEAAHPSPLARTGFFGCGHFSRANQILQSLGKSPIDWDLRNENNGDF